VRRCIEKETGNEYAAKIIDLSSDSEGEAKAMQEATIQEVNILRMVAGHPYISKELFCVYFIVASYSDFCFSFSRYS
jgi:hypothetical protein